MNDGPGNLGILPLKLAKPVDGEVIQPVSGIAHLLPFESKGRKQRNYAAVFVIVGEGGTGGDCSKAMDVGGAVFEIV